MIGEGAADGSGDGSAEIIDMVGSRFELVARMGDRDTDTVLFRTRMAPGKSVPLHSHGDPECFYILAGRLEIVIVGDVPGWRRLDAGASVLIAGGEKHAVRNSADTAADMILATNNRMARFFREAGRPATAGSGFAPPTPEDVHRMLRVAEAYGYWNASPAESASITGA